MGSEGLLCGQGCAYLFNRAYLQVSGGVNPCVSVDVPTCGGLGVSESKGFCRLVPQGNALSESG